MEYKLKITQEGNRVFFEFNDVGELTPIVDSLLGAAKVETSLQIFARSSSFNEGGILDSDFKLS